MELHLSELFSLAHKCLLKVATFAAQLGMYDKAIEKFEEVASASLDNQLMKWSLKEYFLKAGLCHLATGVRTVILSLSDQFAWEMTHCVFFF